MPDVLLSEVLKAIKDTAKDKAAGPDDLDINIIKIAGDPFAWELTKLYNHCLKMRKVPDDDVVLRHTRRWERIYSSRHSQER